MFRVQVLLAPAALISVAVVPLSCGCNRPSANVTLAEVSGQVTLDGKPLPYGLVVFHANPSKGTTGPTGIGAIEKDGTYRMKTMGLEGALVGWHTVTVMAEDTSKPGAPWIIPIRYGNPNKSKLEAEVKANQKNVIPFELRR